MFRAVNIESEYEKKRASQEKHKIQEMYFSCLKTLCIEKFFNIRILFDQNRPFYETARSNLLYNIVRKTSLPVLEKVLQEYDITESKHAFFEFVRKCIDNSMFVRAKKLLNLARKNKWWCNDLFDLEKDIDKLYFSGIKKNENLKFNDFL